jgi:hypothetical protein
VYCATRTPAASAAGLVITLFTIVDQTSVVSPDGSDVVRGRDIL